MLKYIYTDEVDGNAYHTLRLSTWPALLDLLFISDKYGLDSLADAVIAKFEHALRYGIQADTSVMAILGRAADYPGHGRERLQQIVFDLCEKRFRNSYREAGFRGWLASIRSCKSVSSSIMSTGCWARRCFATT